jgi:hypothetical protein
MSREAVGQVLEAMSDEDVRSRIQSGDLAGIPGAAQLTSDETRLVIAASSDDEYPDVAGLAFNSPGLFGGGDFFSTAAHYAMGTNLPGLDAF